MIVKCIKNKREDLSAELLPNYDNNVNGQEIYMEIGQYFFVFGVSFFSLSKNFLISLFAIFFCS
jgi:hypothetical protein